MTPPAEIHVLEDEISLANEVADFVVWTAEQTLRQQPRFRLVLSGGTTPHTLYRTLAQPEWAPRIAWHRVRFFFGDERCVPPDHPESNFGGTKTSLFDPLRIPDGQIARMRGEALPESAARDYETAIRREFGDEPTAVPRFDVVLLGLGDDGHTASLFPGSPALDERGRLVVAASSPAGISQRLTLTYPLLNHAQIILFLVSGSKKASVVHRVLEEGGGVPALPAARIRPTDGRLLWYLDEAAAAGLSAHQHVPQHEE